MARYLDPKADVVFKHIFQEHPHLLKSFLNAVLPLSEDSLIVELEYLPNEQIPKIPILKRTIADVRCKDIHGRTFIVEMQIEWTDCFKQRLLFEASQAYVTQLHRGEKYHLLQPVYGLGIIAATFDSSPVWYHHYQFVNVKKPEKELIKGLELVFIELPKFPIQSNDEKKLRLLWLRFMREINEYTKEVPKELLEVKEISQAIELSEEAAYSKGELENYRAYWDAVSTEKTLISGRYAEGIEKGIEIGIEKGIEKGVEKGKLLGQREEALAIAKQMLAEGIDRELIFKITGISDFN
jgi:predicted transposase/invertase (TIGR01784 family)